MSPVQTSYDYNGPDAMAGMVADSMVSYTASRAALEEIAAGRVVSPGASGNLIRLPISNEVTITEDDGTHTAGALATTITLTKAGGGTIEHSVSESYDTDKATTFAALQATINQLEGLDATLTSATVITVTPASGFEDYDIAIADFDDVTGDVVITIAEDCTDTFLGIARMSPNLEQETEVRDLVSIQKLTFSADLVASNVVAGYFMGTSVSVTYATSHANTMGLLATALRAITGVQGVSVSGRQLTITMQAGYSARHGVWTVTGGASQATIAWADASPGTQVPPFEAGAAVPVARRANIWCVGETAMAVGDTVYVRFREGSTGEYRGQVRNDSDSGAATAWAQAEVVRPSSAAGDLVEIGINLP